MALGVRPSQGLSENRGNDLFQGTRGTNAKFRGGMETKILLRTRVTRKQIFVLGGTEEQFISEENVPPSCEGLDL